MVKSRDDAPPCPFEKVFPSELIRDDVYYMTHACNQALRAWESGDVPIGCVIAFADGILASAHNAVEQMGDATAHAEILALTQASRALGDWRLNECTLYVTKEPCPMCAGAVLMSRVGRVVFGVPDAQMGCLGGATNLNELPRLLHHCEVTSGVLEEECRTMLQTFFRLRREMGKDATA